ncbi:MAG: replicative DNA helicase, partial [Treponema sp.]|nr:replicative DNA helicase [Treponema sp.]
MSSLKDSIPPHNQEAEQALLGALLLDWSAMPETAIFIKADQFYSIQNQLLYSALLSLYNQNIRGDTLTLINQLTKDGTLDKAGGASYIAELTNVVPTAANIKYYAEIIKDHAKRRELIKISNELKLMAVDESRSSKLIIEEAEKKIFALATETQESSVRNMKEVIGETTDIIEKQARNKDFTGIPTGFAALDELTDGFQESDLIIIGARPSIGKTALALSMMEYITVDRKIPCGFFSLEMAYTTIGKRLISQVSQIGAEKIRRGNLRTVDFSKMLDAAGLLYEAPLYIADTPNMRLLELRALARRLVSNNNVKIIFIDYIGLITTENESA